MGLALLRVSDVHRHRHTGLLHQPSRWLPLLPRVPVLRCLNSLLRVAALQVYLHPLQCDRVSDDYRRSQDLGPLFVLLGRQ